jgi:hypothetical protein
MQRKIFYGTILVLTFALTIAIKPSSAVDALTVNDFKLQSFSKTVDFFDYVRQYAASQGMTPPTNASWHAYSYQTYINVSGFQLFYNGLINITAGTGALTIPVQNFLEHYKTSNGKDVLTSSSFIMLLAFNDTGTSKYNDSPDVNDNLYASFSLGWDIANLTGNSQKPNLQSQTTIIQLTTSDNKTWTWGMRYTNLTAIWWRMFTNPLNPRYEPLAPIAITTYEELTFTYKLELNPTDHTAKVTANYVIGRMTNLWLFYWPFYPFPLLPIVNRFNSTGQYWPNGAKISNTTIYQFLEQQHIKMSIVLFQNSLALDQKTASKSTVNNRNVTDAEEDVSNGAISTTAGNEEIFKTDFGSKKQYKLYNYTADPTQTTYNTYDTVTRTAPRTGYAKNPLFSIHVAFLKYVPLIVAHIDPPLYQKTKDHMLNMTYADYFYLISYPKYSGFKIQHDPTYTAYIASTATTTIPPNLFGLLLIGGIIAVVVVGAVIVLRRRGAKTQIAEPQAPPPPSPPTT